MYRGDVRYDDTHINENVPTITSRAALNFLPQ